MSTSAVAALDRANAIPAAPVCRHCGDPCDDTLTTDAGVFCCAGCRAVYDLLTSHGLEAFYRCDVRPGRSQRAVDRRDPDRFAALDLPVVAQRFVMALPGGRQRATFHLPDIHCASCLWLLERLWRFDPGITRSEADVLARVIRIDFDPAVISLRALAERLASLGYEPQLDAEVAVNRTPAHRRRMYLKIGVAGFAFGNVMLFSIPRYVNGAPLEPGFQRLFDTLNLAFAIPVLVYSASEFFQGAWRALRNRSVTLDVPIAIGLAALFGRSVYEIATQSGEGFFDSFAGLVFFLLIGRLVQQRTFEGIAFDRTVRSFLPLSVFVDRGRTVVRLPIEELSPGDVIVVRPGEVVPADATLLDARGNVDYAFVTGEQVPVAVSAGEVVRAGGRVALRSLRLRVRHEASRSELARLWTNPVFDRERPSQLDRVLSRFGQAFTMSALLLAAVGAWTWWPDASMSVQVATAVLIIACPCAFTLAAPLTLGAAAAALGRAGLFLKRPAVALDLGRAQTIVFDKTGTLTTAATAAPSDDGLSAGDLRCIRRLAAESAHPVSRAIAGAALDDLDVEDVHEVAGGGITGRVDGHAVVIGSAPFVSAQIGRPVEETPGVTWASIDGRSAVPLRTAARERDGIDDTTARLAPEYELWLLSGDHATEAPRWAPTFGTQMRFRQSPADKLTSIRGLQGAGRRVLMVGDGLNDAGALAAADVGVAVSDNTACLVPACDAVLLGDRVRDLPALLAYARRAPVVMFVCFAVSLAYNIVGLSLALTGRLTPLVTAVLMPVSSLTIVALATGLMAFGTTELTRRPAAGEGQR